MAIRSALTPLNRGKPIKISNILSILFDYFSFNIGRGAYVHIRVQLSGRGTVAGEVYLQ